jgi:signal peptidase I
LKIDIFKGVLWSTLVIALVIASVVCLLSSGPVHAALTTHEPILIVGNDNFTLANGVSSGSGAENDPYVIENWAINASSAHGITIQNTTAHFVLRNCLVENGGGTYDGIYFDEAINGTAENNIAENNFCGICLSFSDNNFIENNIVENNESKGIELYSSHNNLISGNTLVNDGLMVHDSYQNTIENNTVNGGPLLYLEGKSDQVIASAGQVILVRCENITVENLNLSNVSVGVEIWETDNSRVLNNTVENNPYYGFGIYLSGSDNYLISNNILDNNTCYNCSHGIYFMYTSNNTLTNNTCGNNVYGIWFDSFSSNNTLTNNICDNNSWSGIWLESASDNNTLTNNRCNNNGTGIGLDYSDNNTLTNNRCNNNRFNFGVFGSDFDQNIDNSNLVNGRPIYYLMDKRNLVIGPSWTPGYVGLVRCDNIRVENLVLENSGQGILLASTANSLIENCIFLNNDVGIYFDSSSNNTLTNNTCENNQSDGISLYYSSSNNVLDNNTCYNCSYGIDLSDSSNNIVTNNTCDSNNEDPPPPPAPLYAGIRLATSSNNILTNNACDNNGSGIELDSSSNNTLDNNACDNNNAYAIHLGFSDNNTLTSNTCSNNSNGIYLDSCSYNSLTNNECDNNVSGIYMCARSYHNRIYHNNLINNRNQAYDDGTNYWDDGYPSGGNYWSDYTGVDNFRGKNQDIPGSDGIGDVPYNITGGSNQDRYPLMNLFVPVVKPPTRLPLIAGILIMGTVIGITTVLYARRKHLKKVIKRIRSKRHKRSREVLSAILIIGILYFGIQGAMFIIFRTDSPMLAVRSNSMKPTFERGDMLVLKGVDSISELKVHDIIVYQDTSGKEIVHRVVNISPGNMITTRGDANPTDDPPITFQQVRGKVLFWIPKLGYISLWIRGE